MSVRSDLPDHSKTGQSRQGLIMIVAQVRKWFNQIGEPAFLVIASLSAFVVVIYFFCPAFVYWKGLELAIPDSFSKSEVNRAMATLQKIESPFQSIEYPPGQNTEITWRMLFPLLGHYLHIPRLLFLALPHLGCLLVLGLVAYLVCRQTGDRWFALGTAILMGTSSWFFVSTGWLAYFDSWYVLGLLVVGFVPTRSALIIAAVLTPWVDERFVIAIPIALLVRALDFKNLQQWNPVRYRTEVLIVLGLIIPYLGFRLASTFYGVNHASVFSHLRIVEEQRLLRLAALADEHPAMVTIHVAHLPILSFVPLNLLESHWGGLRAVWLFCGCCVWFAWSAGRWKWGTITVLTIVGCELILMVLAPDFSRNVSTLLPVALLGVLVLGRLQPSGRKEWLYLALAFNLLTPASHGFNCWRQPIYNLYYEVESYKSPPDYLNPVKYNQLAVQLVGQNDWTNALVQLDYALTLNPKHVESLLSRAFVRKHLDDRAGAIQDLTLALKTCPADWPRRTIAQTFLEQIRSVGKTSPAK